MNKLILLISMFVSVSFYSDTEELQINTSSQENSNTIKEPYEIQFRTEKLKNDLYNLIITMELQKGAHYVSPNSKGDYSGVFAMNLEENKQLQMNGKFSENPLSKESTDPWRGSPVNFVRENTTHTQQFTIEAKDDFEVSGWIQFTIEPRCTLEKIHFKITQKSGVLDIQKLATKN